MTKKMMCPRCWGSKIEPGRDDRQCSNCLGDGVKDDVQLSTHFWLSEFLYSQTAVRKRIPNDPSQTIVAALRETAAAAETVRTQFGPVRVNSGFRATALNAAIGGSATVSAHSLGFAVDMDPLDPKVKHKDVMDWIIASSLKYDQAIYEGTWIHLGIWSPSNKQRRQNLMMFPDSRGKTVYTAYDPKDARVNL